MVGGARARCPPLLLRAGAVEEEGEELRGWGRSVREIDGGRGVGGWYVSMFRAAHACTHARLFNPNINQHHPNSTDASLSSSVGTAGGGVGGGKKAAAPGLVLVIDRNASTKEVGCVSCVSGCHVTLFLAFFALFEWLHQSNRSTSTHTHTSLPNSTHRRRRRWWRRSRPHSGTHGSTRSRPSPSSSSAAP